MQRVTGPEMTGYIRRPMTVFKVPDMSCGHCEKSITKGLQEASAEVEVKVDLALKTVEVKNLPDEAASTILKDLGYTPEKVK